MLLRKDPGDATTFSVLFSTWHPSSIMDPSMIMDPFGERWDDVRAYRFYLGRFVAYIKVDRRPFPDPLAKAVLSPNGPLHIISREFAASKD